MMKAKFLFLFLFFLTVWCNISIKDTEIHRYEFKTLDTPTAQFVFVVLSNWPYFVRDCAAP